MHDQGHEKVGGPSLLLNFTSTGRLPGALLRRLDEIAHTRRDEFNAMIARLSKGLEHDIDWWVTWPATRNTHVSKLFTRCVQLALVAELESTGAHPVIVTDDRAFAKLLGAGGQRQTELHRHRQWTAAPRNIASSLLNSASAWIVARMVPPRCALPSSIFAVEEGTNEGSFDEGRKASHYYPGLTELIADTDARAQHIVPVFYRVRSFRKLMRLIRNSDVPFLVREDYLSPADYLFALGHWWRARRFLGRAEQFAGFSIGPLVDAEIKTGRLTNAVFQALLSYRFWRNLSRCKDVRVTTLLDWYEGHDRDHATAAAINWHALPIRHVAYRHLTGQQYLSAVPTQYEIDAGVVPRHFAVAGAHAARDLREAVKGLDIHAAPSLRFARLGDITRQPDTTRPEILVLLGLEPSFLRTAQALLAPAFVAPQLAHVTWVLRPHPLTARREIDKIFGEPPANVRLSVQTFREDLCRASIAMGAGTNALLEALVAGVPVITLAAGNEPTENPVPSWVPAAMAATCYEVDELPALIQTQLAATATTNIKGLRTDLVGDIAMPGLRDALG